MLGFHEGGHRAYVETLTAEHAVRIKSLNEQLESAPSTAAAEQIKEEIARQHKLHRDSVRDARDCLF